MSTQRPPLVTLIAALIIESGKDWMLSADLADRLQHIDPDLWADIDQAGVAAELRPYGIKPIVISREGNRKGYHLKHLAPDIWEQVRQRREELRAEASLSREEAHRGALSHYLKRLVDDNFSVSSGDPLPDLAHAAVTKAMEAPEPEASPCGVYAYEDRDRVLLYVGITSEDDQRDKAHMAAQPWARFVARRIEIDTFAFRASALAREDHLIRTLTPVFNRTRTGWFAAAARYLVEHDATDLLAIRGLGKREGADQAIREMVSIGAFDHLYIRDDQAEDQS